ncbi:MAG TPA: hypothetical protein VGQ83_30930 [Polyangia bacterium]|jgi:hypothetical protein
MTHELINQDTLRRLAARAGLEDVISGEELSRGLEEIIAGLRRVAVEAAEAEARGLRLSVAARDDVGYPSLYRLHVGVEDLLTMELPRELRGWARRALALPGPPIPDEIQIELGRIAASRSHSAVERALARVLLFQGIRVGLFVTELMVDGTLVGAGEDLDEIAEEELDFWLDRGSRFEGEVRPLNVLLAGALVELERHHAEVRALLASLRDEAAGDEVRRRATLEHRLRRMDSADAILVRNAFGPTIGEPRVSLARLKQDHPLALRHRRGDALDRRARRLLERIRRGDWPTRRNVALVDLITEKLKEEMH